MKNLTGIGVTILESGLKQLKDRKVKISRTHNEYENLVAQLEIEEVEWAIKQMKLAYKKPPTQ